MPFWDLHRADLHRGLLTRVRELGGTVTCGAQVLDVQCGSDEATVVLQDGSRESCQFDARSGRAQQQNERTTAGEERPPKPDWRHGFPLDNEDRSVEVRSATGILDRGAESVARSIRFYNILCT